MLVYLLVVVISYFIGTISCAYLISKYIFSKDIRQYGSKNPGTTNMLRTFGKKAGAVTLVGDYSYDPCQYGILYNNTPSDKVCINCFYAWCMPIPDFDADDR